MAEVRLRVVSWNLHASAAGRLDAKIELLEDVRPDLVLLQEISRPVYRALLPNPMAYERQRERPRLFSWGALSTDLTRPRGSEYRLGCAVLGAQGTELLLAEPLNASVFDVDDPRRPGMLRRTVAALVAVRGGATVTACSFQARPTPKDPCLVLPPAFQAGVAQWLTHTAGPIIVGIDARAPEIDHPDPRRSVFRSPAPEGGGHGEDQLLGAEPQHALTDVLRRHLRRQPDQFAQITAQRPDGPLAVSRRVAGRPARHDHIWATPDMEVFDVRYLYEEAVSTGSDHALVLADLRLP
jgi:endonuclease/exonuclease/phosphatase family metal-dependent hydrolase